MKHSPCARSATSALSAIAIVTSLSAASVAFSQGSAGAGGIDLQTIPPEPGQLQQQLSAAPVSMTQAMSTAETAAGGVAVSARANVGADGKVSYEFICTAGGVAKRVVVDGQSGAVVAATLTLNSAVQKALAEVKGVVKLAESFLLNDPPVYIVHVVADQQVHEVTVDAASGKITSNVVKPRFPGEVTTGEIKETKSGLKYIELKEGTGPAPGGPTARVKVHYTGYFVNGEKFDSSVDRGTPAEFTLNGVIAGWSEGVAGMKVGGKRKLIIPYPLGYGESGRGPIPPKATLIFDVELLEIKDPQAPPPGGLGAGGR